MKEEIRVGVEFLRQFLSNYGHQLTPEIIDKFSAKLTILLFRRYVNHWYANIPMKGQAFRCLRIKRSENYIDPVLEEILKELSLTLNQLGLPNDFTLWIDPGEVSVRFGDQVGFTYSIAKLDQTQVMNSVPILQKEKVDEKQEKIEFFDKPTLIVQNTEKILFDEKLTAFIRQNSSNDEGSDVNESEASKKNTNSNIEELIKLSVEKRTISPPYSSCPINKSSSNIIIECNKPFRNLDSDINTKSKFQENTVSFSGLNNKSQLFSTNDDKNQIKQCAFSFNDSCYYSSSSSSCASSFGSNNDENNFLYGWLYNENNKNIQNKNSNKGLLNLINENNNTEGFKKQSSHFSDTSNKIAFRPRNNYFVPLAKQRQHSFLNDSNIDSSNIDIFNNISHLNMNQNSNIYSDTSSERSDTPSSSITNASSVSSNFVNLVNLNNNTNLPFYIEKNAYESTIENSVPASSSSSSDTSTTTLSTHIDNIHNDDLNILNTFKLDIGENKTDMKCIEKSEQIQDNIAFKIKSDSEKNYDQKSKLVSFSSVEIDLKTKEKTQNNRNDTKTEKDDTYCGYVESFPYYYKLNRLYNALAVQKLQADRLRKSNNSSPFMIPQNINNNPASNIVSYSPKSNTPRLSANIIHQNRLIQWDSKTNSLPINQNHLQMPQKDIQYLSPNSSSTSKSQVLQNQQNSILISTNSPPNHQYLDNFQNQHMNSHHVKEKFLPFLNGNQNINMFSLSPNNNNAYINHNQQQNQRSSTNNNRHYTNKPKQHQNQYKNIQTHQPHMTNSMHNKNKNNKLNNKNPNSIDQSSFVLSD